MIFKIIRIVFKILFCLSVLISIDMLCRYLNYYAEPSDGMSIWLSPITLLLYGDESYTSKELLSQFLTPAGYTCLFFVVNIVFDIIAIVKQPKQKQHTGNTGGNTGDGSLC